MKLSIVTPYYNALEYIRKLNYVLSTQLNDKVEWIVVDDGCNEVELDSFNAKVIHLEHNSGGASVPRNVGIENAQGEYIAFIDADDCVTFDYIEKLLKKIEEGWDYFYYGWASPKYKIVIEDEPPFWNCCVWNCVYKRELIGNERFNPEIIVGEDYDFNIRVRKGTHSSIKDILYYYNDTPNSLIKRSTQNDK